MKLRKKNIIIILLILVCIMPVGITFSKFVGNFVGDYILKANNFFFNSDKLEEETAIYNINNWSGVNYFEIQFELNNRENNLLSSESDITYTVSATCSADVTCTLSSTSGTILTSELKDDFILRATPNRIFDTDETVTVNIVAESTSPYKKTLSGTFNVTVGKKGIDYEIVDEGNKYFLFKITNALDQYKVNEAFDTYSVGDVISIDAYRALSSENRLKCSSAIITLSFNPSTVIVDPTSTLMEHATYTTLNVGGVSYIDSITFNIEATSSNEVRFYKRNTTKNYTYPFGTEPLVVQFNAET